MKKRSFWFLCLMLLVASCKKDDKSSLQGIWNDCVFVVNEGLYQTGSGTVMAFNRNTKEISGDLFESVNGRPLGNVVQSMTVYNDLGFILVNNSNKIEVVKLEDFSSVKTIDSIFLPRYMVTKDKKAYVSSWQNLIEVISLDDYKVVDEFQVGNGPDEMVLSGEYLFVVNSGGFGNDSTISYVNVNHKEDAGRIELGQRPSGMVRDKNGRLWVLCSGKGWNGYPADDDTPGKLFYINPDNRVILKEVDFQAKDKHPDDLIINDAGTTLYYYYPGGIFSFSIDDEALASSPLVSSDISFYALGFDPVTQLIYAADPLDYAQDGRIYRYDALDGSTVDSFKAGVIPGGFFFN